METRPNSTRPAGVGIDTSLADAASLMTALDLPSVPVLDNDAMVGTLAYRDVVRGLRQARHGLTVSALMMPDPIGSPADATLPESAAGGPAGIEERAPALFAPDVLLPSQYFDRLRRRTEYDPERRLMVAILEQGVNDYLKHAGARERKELELWHEVEAWIEDRAASWFFSFESICHVLDLEPEYLRRGLHAYKERVRGDAREEPPISAAPETRPERARASSG
jgi:hypothetical protein